MRFYAILFLFSAACGSQVQETATLSEEGAIATIEFLEKRKRLSKSEKDSIHEVKFYFINNVKKELEIEYVNPDCTCTDYAISANSVAAADTGWVSLYIDVPDQPAGKRINAVIKSNARRNFERISITIEP